MKTGVQNENTILFKIAPKMKYLGINLTKHVQDLYAENYKMLMKEFKDLTSRDMPSRIVRLNIVNMQVLQN